jgi:hypothetical protein
MMALPLLRSLQDGGEGDAAFVTLVTQFLPPQHILITSAADFQAFGTSASPHALLTLYRELVVTKGIILGRIDVVGGAVLTKEVARTFVELLASMYLQDERFEHVRQFNSQPQTFEFDAVLALFGLHQREASQAVEKK